LVFTGPSLWSYDGQAKIAFLPLLPHASYRRSALQGLYRKMEEEIENLTQQVAEQAEQRCRSRLLMTHPGVGQLRRWPRKYAWVIRGGS
jgi:transposase